MGDVFESFSQYSLNSSLKGGSYRYNDSKDKLPEVTLVAGTAYPRWESWWKNNAKSIERFAYGANIKHEVLSDLVLGVSALKTDDSKRINPTDVLYDNMVVSLDGQYTPLAGLTINAEGAFSNINADDSINTGFANGNAVKVEIVGDQNPSRVVLGYERVSPEFETLLGSAIRDRERASAKWRYKWTKKFTLNSNFTWYRTSLDDSENGTNNYKPEIGFTLKKLFDRRYSNLSFNVKLDVKNSQVAENNTSNYFTDLGYRDRFIGLDVDAGVGMSSYKTDKDTTDTADYTARLSVSTRKSFEKVIVAPSLNASSSYIDDDINNATDKIYDYSLALGIDLPDSNITSNFRVGQNLLQASKADDAEALFVSANIYYHPESLLGLTDCTIFVRVMMNDFAFQTDIRNYNEKSYTMGFSFPVDFQI